MDRELALVLAVLLLGGVSSRLVKVSPGPLIRVEGQPVSIRCDVSEYGGPRVQDFEWEMSQDASGPTFKIISTFDSAYPHSSFSKRVASGDISVQRLSDSQVELKVGKVKSSDAGFYWCQTPSTDSVIIGNYKAQVQLIVIADTLKVSPEAPPPVVLEGSDITLSCNVTRELTQPTYLSVTWSVKRGTSSEDILVFGPQMEVVVGSKYARRYADGRIRLVPGKNGVFELVVTRVTTSDDGVYECHGTEWTLEEGGHWVKIVESKKEMGTVSVTPTDQCTLFAVVGHDVTVPLTHELGSGFRLTWIHDDNTVYAQRGLTVLLGQKEDINANGSLLLKSVSREQGGKYQAEVYDTYGRQVGISTSFLCFRDEVELRLGWTNPSSSPSKPATSPASLSATETTTAAAEAAAADQCTLFAVVGHDVTVPLTHELGSGFRLTWIHDDNIVYAQRGLTVLLGQKEDINADGSLLLKSVSREQGGKYQAEVYDTAGRQVGISTSFLCFRGSSCCR